MTGTPPFECGPECPAPDHHGRGPRIQASSMPAAAATAGAAGAAVQGPAAPSSWDLIWATGQTQAANEDPYSTRASREVAAAAEQAAFRAAQHIGLDDPGACAHELELAGTEPEAAL